ncbi:MAG TPA: metallophosphoesterase [Candidatus Eremiobacteraceae bacterium]|nr:metallophosphoesterase [Candidatus Eremiobacteraceae bacterium]
MPRERSTPLPQPVFNEGNLTPDPTQFKVKHPSDNQQYKQIEALLTKDVVSFEPSRGQPGDVYTLQAALGSHGPEVVQGIKQAGKIVFHCAGDTGASSEGKYGNELRVSDQVTQDCRASDPAGRPAFFFHLGDVVYNFGESKYYYDQFYEPYRNYPAPIFAVPGNHDSFVIPGTSAADAPLTVFMRNFCAEAPTITQEAASLHRTAMTQPGVYFALDAPFVRLIGLFSNALEDPGVISSENGKWPGVPDVQLQFLTAQLQRIKKENYRGAVLLAMHHPPFCYTPGPKSSGAGGDHAGSPNMLRQIDAICKAQGVYPHAVLSGHAHNYQRFTRTMRFAGRQIQVPFIICGDGGHDVLKLVKAKAGQSAQEPQFGVQVDYLEPPKPPIPAKSLVLNHYDDVNYGYLRVTVDNARLQVGFHQVGKASIAQSRTDLVVVDLASQTLVAN